MNNDIIAYLSAGFVLVLALIAIFLLNALRNKQEDTERINFLQARRLRICCIDEKFGVIKDGVVIGIGLTGDLREAIDGARAETESLEEV